MIIFASVTIIRIIVVLNIMHSLLVCSYNYSEYHNHFLRGLNHRELRRRGV